MINGGVARKGGVILKKGDQVELHISLPQPLELKAQKIELEIIYEDPHILVLNKPAGMVVHPSKGHEDSTLVNALLAHCDCLPGIGGKERPGIVHRLDKGTSGVMVVAKSETAHRGLVRAFSEHRVEKTYLAVVHGVPQPLNQEISLPIARNPKHRIKMGVVEGGRDALTIFEVVSSSERFALLKVRIATGRTHQIRVHTSHIGHPVVGDELYGRKDDPLRYGIDRPALHSWILKFSHPITGEDMNFEAPIPSDIRALTEVLGLDLSLL